MISNVIKIAISCFYSASETNPLFPAGRAAHSLANIDNLQKRRISPRLFLPSHVYFSVYPTDDSRLLNPSEISEEERIAEIKNYIKKIKTLFLNEKNIKKLFTKKATGHFVQPLPFPKKLSTPIIWNNRLSASKTPEEERIVKIQKTPEYKAVENHIRTLIKNEKEPDQNLANLVRELLSHMTDEDILIIDLDELMDF